MSNFPKQSLVNLPPSYHILPTSIDFMIPGFPRSNVPGVRTLALTERDCSHWFHEFVDRLVAACGKEYLPVCRMSDGEFRFCVGDQPPSINQPWIQRLKIILRQKLLWYINRGNFIAQTVPNVASGSYSSGFYSLTEWKQAEYIYPKLVSKIADRGILALHFSYGKKPFQEHYFPAFGEWLQKHQIVLNHQNYVPFYFVYAALTGERRSELLKKKQVLVINSSQGNKRRSIEEGLRREGVEEVFWLPISSNRSLFDRIDISAYSGCHKFDLALIGAGIGKPNILCQLESLNIPCIDAGYVFEVWANPEMRHSRPFCIS